MKPLLIFISCLLFLSCSQNDQDEYDDTDTIAACGCDHPKRDLPWLKELIKKSKTDETGNYWGTIWLEKYKGQDIFVTNMMLGSGGVLYYVFDCSGSHYEDREGYCPAEFVGNHHFSLDDFPHFNTLELNVVIYSTHPL